MRVGALFALVAACALATAVRAQPAAPAPDESAVVDDLAPVVVRMPGPALWKVTRGDSQVVILGYFQPLPHALDWPKGRMIAAMDGAHAVLLPPDPRLGPMDALTLAFSAGALHNPGGKTLAERVPAADYARFKAYVALSGMDEKHYARWRPLLAGTALISDVRRKAGLSSAKPVSTVSRLAKEHRIVVRTVGRFGVAQAVRSMTSLSPDQELACFRATLDELDWETRVAPRAAEAWARADLAALRALRPPSALETCAEDLPAFRRIIDQGTAAATAELDEALSRPGKVVALVDMRFLDRRNGLLDRLRDKGARISTPD